MADVLAALRPIAGVAVPTSRLETDLGMDSVELAAFAAELRGRFGDQVDLIEHLAGLTLDELIELTVGEVAGFVAGRLSAATGAGSG